MARPIGSEGRRRARLEKIGRELLLALGRDPVGDPGVTDTPRRFAQMWIDFIGYDAGKIDTAFEAVQVDQVVIVTGIKVWSMCEHHLLPFWCELAIGYRTGRKLLGLSKFGRIAHKHAHRLQLQERLVEDISAELRRILDTEDVAVLARGEHLCMTMRGIRSPHVMVSSSMHGLFRGDGAARREFMALATAAPPKP